MLSLISKTAAAVLFSCAATSAVVHATAIPVKAFTHHSIGFEGLFGDIVSEADYEAVARHIIEKRISNGIITTCTIPNTLAITFDDGPSRYTPDLLDYLNEEGVKVTFFMDGDNVDNIYEYDWIVKRAYNEGHQVASHTWSHPDLNELSKGQIESEMKRLEEAFKSIIGVRPTYMRPPYGNVNAAARRTLSNMGYKIVLWSIDTNDWRHPDNVETSMRAYREALSQPDAHKRGHIALQHDTHKTTALKRGLLQSNMRKRRGSRLLQWANAWVSPRAAGIGKNERS
ncbi:MAG: hypothetical protein J3Q66DRAFT_412272 [Benniella sp.]|nr:MAG: hypothetical protein J3Q66DRAFT_412272 [Benniella sp.]